MPKDKDDLKVQPISPSPFTSSSRQRKRNAKKSSESITFRLDSNLLDGLRNEADRKEVSVNTLANQILKQHNEWHAHSVTAGFLSVRRALISNLLEKVTEEEIPKLAQHILNKDIKGWIIMLKSEYNIESALEIIETWIKVSGYTYRHNVEDETRHSFIIKHDMGRKWSLYLKEIYSNMFVDFGISKPYFDINDDILSFKIDTESMI